MLGKDYRDNYYNEFTQRQKLNIGQFRVTVLRAMKQAWDKLCDDRKMMIASFRSLGLSLNIDGSEDDQMHFQGKPRGLPSDIVIG